MTKAHIFEARQRTSIDSITGVRTPANDHFFDSFIKALGGKPKPAVSGSDAHSIDTYASFPVDQHGYSRSTWVKADPTFRGVGHIRNHPASRVFIGPELPQARTRPRHPTRYIDRLRICKNDMNGLDELWFDDVDIQFNSDLVAVIGNKGNGKSALADILGLLGSSRNLSHGSFLNAEKFRHPRLNKAKFFDATLTWANGETLRRSLNEPAPSTDIERVRYLPQNYLETVCNEIKHRHGAGFDAELKAVIFSHVPRADRLELDSLDALIEYRTKQVNDTIGILKAALHDINLRCDEAETKASPQFRQRLENRIALKNQEILAQQGNKPEQVPPPASDQNLLKEAATLGERIDSVRSSLETVESEIRQAATSVDQLTLLLAKLTAVGGQLDNFERALSGNSLRTFPGP